RGATTQPAHCGQPAGNGSSASSSTSRGVAEAARPSTKHWGYTRSASPRVPYGGVWVATTSTHKVSIVDAALPPTRRPRPCPPPAERTHLLAGRPIVARCRVRGPEGVPSTTP